MKTWLDRRMDYIYKNATRKTLMRENNNTLGVNCSDQDKINNYYKEISKCWEKGEIGVGIFYNRYKKIQKKKIGIDATRYIRASVFKHIMTASIDALFLLIIFYISELITKIDAGITNAILIAFVILPILHKFYLWIIGQRFDSDVSYLHDVLYEEEMRCLKEIMSNGCANNSVGDCNSMSLRNLMKSIMIFSNPKELIFVDNVDEYKRKHFILLFMDFIIISFIVVIVLSIKLKINILDMIAEYIELRQSYTFIEILAEYYAEHYQCIVVSFFGSLMILSYMGLKNYFPMTLFKKISKDETDNEVII